MENLAETYQRMLHQIDRRSHIREGIEVGPLPNTTTVDLAAEIYKDILEEFRRSEPDNPQVAFKG